MAKVQLIIHIQSVTVEVEEDVAEKFIECNDSTIALVTNKMNEVLKKSGGPLVEYVEEL